MRPPSSDSQGQVVWRGDDDSKNYEIFHFDSRSDLSVHVLQVDSAGRRWDPVNVKVVIRNRGFLPANDFYLDVYQDLQSPPETWWPGDVSRWISELGPHEGVAYYFRLTYDMDGTYDVYAQVDTDQNVPESNEDNNIRGPETVVIDPDADIDRDGDVDGQDLALLGKEEKRDGVENARFHYSNW